MRKIVKGVPCLILLLLGVIKAGALTETCGRPVKQFFSIRGQKYPYPDYALNGIWQQEFEQRTSNQQLELNI
jgi:hypothetical protein